MAQDVDSSQLFRARVLLLTGKGGTGKTTLAAAVAQLGASQGRRVVLCELDSQRPSLTPIFGRAPVYAPTTVSPGLDICNIEWMPALDDWLADLVGAGRIVRMIMKNRMVSLFLEATPGARDLMLLLRVVRLAEQYDLVVVDMPASGNAAGMLSVIGTSRRLFDAGPIRRCAEQIGEMLARPDTLLALVALPEEMVVNETLETRERLLSLVPGLRVGLCLLNRATRPSLTQAELTLLAELEGLSIPDAGRELLAAGRWEANLERATAEAEARLGECLPTLSLPVLARGEGAARVVNQLTSALARQSKVKIDLVVGR